MRTRQGRASPNAFVSLAVGLSLTLSACGSGTGQETSTTTAGEAPTTMSESTSTTVGAPSTTTSIATATTGPAATTTEPDVIEMVVADGEVVSGPDRILAELGSMVHFVVVSDVSDHLHVHGYDLFFDIATDVATEIMFSADVPGIFEVELEGSRLPLVELEVS